MAKRASKKTARRTSTIGWADAVAYVREYHVSKTECSAAVSTLYGWEQFAGGWEFHARLILQHAYPTSTISTKLHRFDMSEWCWAEIESTGAIDVTLEEIDRCCTIPSANVLSCFDTLRSNALIFPDGTMHQSLAQLHKSHASQARAASNIKTTTRAIREIQAANALSKLTQTKRDK